MQDSRLGLDKKRLATTCFGVLQKLAGGTDEIGQIEQMLLTLRMVPVYLMLKI